MARGLDWGGGVDELIATACFAVAVAVGLAGAFIGLDVSSLWYDELYTAWVVHPDDGVAGLVDRLARDVSPPLYYVLLYPFALVFGEDERGLRGFSALCAVAAVVLFIVGGRSFFSLRARLFGGALATGSFFWFFQAQNARYYALTFLVGVGILLLSLSVLGRAGRPDPRISCSLAGLMAVMFAGSFVHFYVLYECLAVLIVLWLLCPRQRLALAGFAVALSLSGWLYVKLVVARYSHNVLDRNWIVGDAAWYASELRSAFAFSVTGKALLAIALCLAVAIIVRPLRIAAWRRSAPDPQVALFIGVPLVVLAGGLASSLLISPNFTARNLLVCSPFLWALGAKLYDGGVPQASLPLRRAANVALSALAVWMVVTMTSGRTRAWNEPFRQSAAWIASIPACRDQVIPVISTERREWLRSTSLEGVYRFAYARYLDGFADPRVTFLEDFGSRRLPDDLRQELRRRVDGAGCPVLAWAVHRITPEELAGAGADLLRMVGRADAGTVLRIKTFRDGQEGYVLYADRNGK